MIELGSKGKKPAGGGLLRGGGRPAPGTVRAAVFAGMPASDLVTAIVFAFLSINFTACAPLSGAEHGVDVVHALGHAKQTLTHFEDTTAAKLAAAPVFSSKSGGDPLSRSKVWRSLGAKYNALKERAMDESLRLLEENLNTDNFGQTTRNSLDGQLRDKNLTKHEREKVNAHLSRKRMAVKLGRLFGFEDRVSEKMGVILLALSVLATFLSAYSNWGVYVRGFYTRLVVGSGSAHRRAQTFYLVLPVFGPACTYATKTFLLPLERPHSVVCSEQTAGNLIYVWLEVRSTNLRLCHAPDCLWHCRGSPTATARSAAVRSVNTMLMALTRLDSSADGRGLLHSTHDEFFRRHREARVGRACQKIQTVCEYSSAC